MTRILAPLLLVSAATLTGCIGTDSGTTYTSSPIVNGTLGGTSAVVVLQNYRSGGLCTGSLIAERVVLTAKHCIQAPFAEGPIAPSDLVIGVGDSIRAVSSVLRPQAIYTTPGVYTEDSRGGIDRTLVGSDVAVVVLQSGTAGVEPLPIMRESHTTLGGQTITAVGFGQTPSGQVGVKYTATGRITGTDSQLIYVGALTCQGDSGGPAITESGEVAGVVSFGAGGCGTGYGAYNAIFPFLDLIDQALTEAGSCLNDGEERCDGADNDCDDLVDETCTALGGACTSSEECIGLQCENTPAGRICTAACDPLRPDFGCDPGLYCARTDGCDGRCVPLEGDAALPVGAACDADGDCGTLFCLDPGDGSRRCLSPCRGDAGMCLAGEACAAAAGACGGCVEAGIVVGRRGLGEECAEDTDCGSNTCLDDAGRLYCSSACEDDLGCPNGYHCRDNLCASGPRGEIGDPCTSNGDCASGAFCANRGDQSWCTRLCDREECPDGFSCVEAGGFEVCAPVLGLLGDACASDEECVSGICDMTEGSGECSRMCSSDAPCAAGFACERQEGQEDGLCVTPSAPLTEGGGCSVSRGGQGASAAFAAVWMVFGLALLRRRRRSA